MTFDPFKPFEPFRLDQKEHELKLEQERGRGVCPMCGSPEDGFEAMDQIHRDFLIEQLEKELAELRSMSDDTVLEG